MENTNIRVLSWCNLLFKGVAVPEIFSLTESIRDSEGTFLLFVETEHCLLPTGLAVQLSTKPRLPRPPKPTRTVMKSRILTCHSVSSGYRSPLLLSMFNLLSARSLPWKQELNSLQDIPVSSLILFLGYDRDDPAY